ncbi:acid protease [Trichocladium antarcticum]|uniref:Acid protease n=1 Tax=Trichocladium antarcticum TaxID=1450529 RepID=A0AAN6ZFA4_9PEZI|nr:acid protease [Trichocladium antarcticum]
MVSLLRLIAAAICLTLSLAHAIPARNYGNRWNIARRSVSLDLTRNPDYAPNGPAAYARALKKWGAEVPSELVHSLAAMKANVGEVGAASIRGDREFLSRVGYGTPPQYLDVDFDTGSSDVWVYTSETRKHVAGGRPVWVIEDSKTAKRVHNATWMIAYGDGSHAWGNVYKDTLSIGNITLPAAVIESATSASLSLTNDPDIDGIFGLAYGLPSQTEPQQPSVLSALTPLLSAPVFTADLQYHSSCGAYTFGYIDHARHTANTTIHYTPLVADATFWQFGYTGLHVGGQNVWYLSERWTAIADTGTTLLLLGADVVELYYATGVPGARHNTSIGGIWTYPCAGPALPDFEIGMANGWVATVPGRFMNYSVMPDDPATCMGGLQTFGLADFGIFGDIFLKAVYAVFDVGGARIGFADKPLDLE